eukprot:1507004-Pyramimonas_sp.AAC.1
MRRRVTMPSHHGLPREGCLNKRAPCYLLLRAPSGPSRGSSGSRAPFCPFLSDYCYRQRK